MKIVTNSGSDDEKDETLFATTLAAFGGLLTLDIRKNKIEEQ